jgi:integrase
MDRRQGRADHRASGARQRDERGDPAQAQQGAHHTGVAKGLLEAVAALYARAGVPKPPKPIHCLRHTFGTVMARRVPLGVLQRLMGHSEVSTTMRYVDVGEEDKRDAIAAVFGAFGQQVGNKAGEIGSTKAISVDKLS